MCSPAIFGVLGPIGLIVAFRLIVLGGGIRSCLLSAAFDRTSETLLVESDPAPPLAERKWQGIGTDVYLDFPSLKPDFV